jgi:hypothetical protein
MDFYRSLSIGELSRHASVEHSYPHQVHHDTNTPLAQATCHPTVYFQDRRSLSNSLNRLNTNKRHYIIEILPVLFSNIIHQADWTDQPSAPTYILCKIVLQDIYVTLNKYKPKSIYLLDGRSLAVFKTLTIVFLGRKGVVLLPS